MLGFVVCSHATDTVPFSAAEQASLEVLAELIGLTVRDHYKAIATLNVVSVEHLAGAPIASAARWSSLWPVDPSTPRAGN